MAQGWPVVLRDGAVTVRPLRRRDRKAWVRSRQANVAWLKPWEATPPSAPSAFGMSNAVFRVMTRRLRQEARHGRSLPFTILLDDDFAGQITVAGIVRGSLLSAHIGYWVDERVAGQGVMPTALALVVDHLFGPVGLHRVEVNVRPENAASRRVAEKLGFRIEGSRPRYLHIGGAWRDHLAFVLTREEVGPGLLARWHASEESADTPSTVRVHNPGDG